MLDKLLKDYNNRQAWHSRKNLEMIAACGMRLMPRSAPDRITSLLTLAQVKPEFAHFTASFRHVQMHVDVSTLEERWGEG